jgi:hypothetical protein
MAHVSNIDRYFGTAAKLPGATYLEMEPAAEEDREFATARGIGLGVALGTVAWVGLGLGIWLPSVSGITTQHGSAAIAGEGSDRSRLTASTTGSAAVPFQHHAEHHHHIPKPRYRVTNRPDYDAALRRRGA